MYSTPCKYTIHIRLFRFQRGERGKYISVLLFGFIERKKQKENEDKGGDNTLICLKSASVKMKTCNFQIFTYVPSYFIK